MDLKAKLDKLWNQMITPHFAWKEMFTSAAAARAGIENIPESDDVFEHVMQVADALEDVRHSFGDLPIHVLSCYRCPEVNKLVGGAKTSAHMKGLAVDFTIKGLSNADVCHRLPLVFSRYDQIIYEFGETGWVHLGLAAVPRREIISAVSSGGHTVYVPGVRTTA